MNAQDLTLNIAVNLGRLSRWAQDGKKTRINLFLKETQDYLDLLEKANIKPEFKKTFVSFKKNFRELQKNQDFNSDWAEQALTWANILSHRAKLA